MKTRLQLLVRSSLLILTLYGMVFVLGDLYLARHGAPLWLACLFAGVFVALQYGLGPFLIQWLMRIQWDDDRAELPVRNREFLERVCAQRGLRMPRIGIIRSNTPNAFTFGHSSRNARVVVTTGLLKLLTPEESNAVLAHELGHVENQDFIIMTLAALAPLLLYQLYVFTRSGSKTRPLAIGAYVCYWISQFLVYLLSRTREYMADAYSARVTGEPEALSSALMKIAYGLVQADGNLAEAMESAESKEKAALGRQRKLADGIALMGIANFHSAEALALAPDAGAAASIMRWDLVNPWARVYELGSTHPLSALRIRALNRAAEEMHREVLYPLPDGGLRWKTFVPELAIWAAPALFGLAAAIAYSLRHTASASPTLPPALLMLCGMSWIARIWVRYSGKFRPATVRDLLQDLDVSQMRTRAVRLEGTIIGFGVPGAFWSPDLVLRDSTGLLYMLYRQSIPLARFWFAVTEADTYINQKVVIEGWFRRGLRPYVEMGAITTEDGKGHRAWSRWIQYGVACLVCLAAAIWQLRVS